MTVNALRILLHILRLPKIIKKKTVLRTADV